MSMRMLLRILLATACCVVFHATVTHARVQAQDAVSNPQRRREYIDQQRAYPFAQIPLRPMTRQQLVAAFRRSIPLSGSSSLAIDGDWTLIGPSPIGNVDAGRVAALAIDPRNPQVIYAGAAQGGVWKTTNGGASWTPLTDTQCSLATGSIALDPLNPDIVYVGTGEQNYSGDSYYGCGVLKSTNGGVSWTTLGGSIFDTNTGGARIGSFAIVPGVPPATQSSVLLTASTFGVYRSADAGLTWTRITIAANPNSQATDIVVHPSNPNIVFAAYSSTGFNAANGIYRSTNGGVSFPTKLVNGLPTANVGRIRLAIAPSGPDTMYAAVHNTSSSQLLGIWRSIDGGENWLQMTAQNASCGSQCWYNLHITIDPRNAATLYLGGVALYKSVDGANTFTNIGSSIHVDHHAFVFDPTNANIVIAGSDGGVYRSINAGMTWASINANLAITQFYHGISFGQLGAAQMLGGTQDNGTAAYSGLLRWPRVIGADGGYTAINPVTGMSFGETQWSSSFGGPRRALTFTGPFGSPLQNGIDMADAALFIPPIEMDVARPHILFFGTSKLYRTHDNGDSWLAINPTPGRTANGRVSAIAPARSDSNVIYVGTSDGNVQVTTNGGTNWSSRIVGLPTRYITDMVVHRSNADVAYVTVSGFGTGHVWKTSNAGVNWQNISSNLPDLPVNGMTLLPDGSLHIGTDLGVYRTTNDGASWEPFGRGLPNVAVFDIAYHRATSTLAAATHGRSIFATTVTAPVVATALAVVTNPLAAGSGMTFLRQPVVQVVGVAGDSTDGSNAITVSVASGTGTLSGTLTVSAVAGAARFTNLALTGTGAVQLRFTSPGLAPVTTASFQIAPVVGDVTLDGVVNAADAGAVLSYSVQLPVPGGYRLTPNGDANCDGRINAFDAAIILAYVAGRDVSRFCVGRPTQ